MRMQRPPEQLVRQAGFPSSDKTRPDSPVPTLQGPCDAMNDHKLCSQNNINLLPYSSGGQKFKTDLIGTRIKMLAGLPFFWRLAFPGF